MVEKNTYGRKNMDARKIYICKDFFLSSFFGKKNLVCIFISKTKSRKNKNKVDIYRVWEIL